MITLHIENNHDEPSRIENFAKFKNLINDADIDSEISAAQDMFKISELDREKLNKNLNDMTESEDIEDINNIEGIDTMGLEVITDTKGSDNYGRED